MSKLLPVGTEVYYTGDAANLPAKGHVKAHRQRAWGISVDLHIEGGREILGLTMAHFAPGPGRRFWTLEEWRKDRREKVDAVQKQMQEATGRKNKEKE